MYKTLRAPLLALCTLAVPHLALAHAVLMASTPSQDATTPEGPAHIDLRFNSRVDGVHSTLALVAPDGRVSPLSLDHQPAANQLAAHATFAHPGAYVIRWQALAGDGHITRGQIEFHVR